MIIYKNKNLEDFEALSFCYSALDLKIRDNLCNVIEITEKYYCGTNRKIAHIIDRPKNIENKPILELACGQYFPLRRKNIILIDYIFNTYNAENFNENDFKLILYPVGQIDSLINSPWQQIAQKTKQKFIIFVLNELEKYGTTIYPKDFHFFDMINDFRGIQSFEFFIDEHKIGLKYNDKISIIVAETLF